MNLIILPVREFSGKKHCSIDRSIEIQKCRQSYTPTRAQGKNEMLCDLVY
ncbi:hypothetical protein [Microcoleus sp. BROC3]